MAEARVRVPGVEARAGKFPGPSLIPALNAIQERVGWLPREELVALSRDVRRPLYEIEGLISFYPHFRTDPPVKAELRVCHDLSCWLRGADERIAALKERYGADVDVEIVEGSCLGRCDSAPAGTVNEVPISLDMADAALAAAMPGGNGGAGSPPVSRGGPEGIVPPGQTQPNDPYSGPGERYAVLRDVLAGRLETAEIITALKDSGLRGMGGAGFPAGRKWDLVAAQEASPKYVICNADESEPGTFKDREILATQPHLVLEGMLLGLLAVGAEEGWVFIRHEYGPEEQVIRREIERLRETGLIGPDAGGSGTRLSVEVFTSPGGYILGEESALIECMEGHRGEPRNKPPFPGTYGLHGQPTLMNSVETFAHVPAIAARGARWWQEQGLGDHAGLKFFAVSGHVERPGVYCVPMGTTARTLLDLAGGVAGGRRLGAIQPGGASSNFIGPGQLDVELDFGTLQAAGSMLGSGAIVVMAEGTDLLAAAVNVLRFFRDESCGKCVPCRVGSAKAHAILGGVLGAGGGPADVGGDIRDLADVMRRTSICGLGQVALGPVMSVLRLAEDQGLAGIMAEAGGREFFTTRTVAAALAGFRPRRRTGTESVPLHLALHRVPGAPVTAPHPLPGFPRSTVDGYAVRAADTYGVSEGLPGYLDVTGAVRMGAAPPEAVTAGRAIAMPTGGVIPPGADAVVMIEYTAEVMPGTIEVVRPVAPGEGIVRADEDARAGDEIVGSGRLLRPQDLGMLAAAGVTSVSVRKKPVVTIFSTGDEVVPPDTRELKPGQVRDATAVALAALVADAGGEPVFGGIMPDDPGALEKALRDALPASDVIVISAGSSVGTRDETANAVARLGEPGIWCHGLAIKPGKPTLLAECQGVPVIRLPGNPRSALVVFRMIGAPVVRLVGGCPVPPPEPSTRARLSRGLASATGRLDVVQVKVSGGVAVPVFGLSALLSVLTAADGYIVIPAEATGIDAGREVDVILYA